MIVKDVKHLGLYVGLDCIVEHRISKKVFLVFTAELIRHIFLIYLVLKIFNLF